jgi:uncharacterized protein (TIGR02246 family)
MGLVIGEDRRAIFKAVENWRTAWERSDPGLATRDYAEDADWTNAFGVTCNSRAELESTLAHIFSLPYVMVGRDRIVGQEIRCVRPDVVLVRTRVERSGQLTPSGEPLGTRHTTHLRVFARNELGWKIVSHLISDARAQQRPQR